MKVTKGSVAFSCMGCVVRKLEDHMPAKGKKCCKNYKKGKACKRCPKKGNQ